MNDTDYIRAEWAEARSMWSAELKIHNLRGERPTARYTAYVWWVWYGPERAMDKIGLALADDSGSDYWHNVGYYVLHPEQFQGDWEQWEKRR